MDKRIIIGIIVGAVLFSAGSVWALPILTAPQGGTGIGSATAGDVGTCIKVLDDSPFTYELGTCGSGGGGGSDPFTHPDSPLHFATTTSATTTSLWLQGSLYSLFASSTAVLTNASTTQLSISDLLTISGSDAPVTTYVGSASFDTNAWASGRGTLQLNDGTANTYLLGTLTSDTPSNTQVPKWNTGGTITWENDIVGANSKWGTSTLDSTAIQPAGATKVGIGTSQPTGNLHLVHTNDGNGLYVTNLGAGENSGRFTLQGQSSTLTYGATSETYGGVFSDMTFIIANSDASQGIRIGTQGQSPIIFQTTSGNSERMRITAAGDVNIGVASTSPTAKLTVTNPNATSTILFEDEASDATPFYIGASGLTVIGSIVPVRRLTVIDPNASQLSLGSSDAGIHWNIRAMGASALVNQLDFSTSTASSHATGTPSALSLRSGDPTLLVGTSTPTAGITVDVFNPFGANGNGTSTVRTKCIVLVNSNNNGAGTNDLYLSNDNGTLKTSTLSCF